MTIVNSKKVDAVRQIVADQIAENPYELDGFKWCAMPPKEIVAKLGFSVATLRLIISKPPFVRQAKEINGKKTTLLREGEPGPARRR